LWRYPTFVLPTYTSFGYSKRCEHIQPQELVAGQSENHPAVWIDEGLCEETEVFY
jgi:hypothetical protein